MSNVFIIRADENISFNYVSELIKDHKHVQIIMKGDESKALELLRFLTELYPSKSITLIIER
jgi:alpha-D-ribose 1-methylphosphonate 5-triphosphate synthase subunit PhnH